MGFILECLAMGVRAALVCGAFVASTVVIAPIIILVVTIVSGVMGLLSGGTTNNG